MTEAFLSGPNRASLVSLDGESFEMRPREASQILDAVSGTRVNLEAIDISSEMRQLINDALDSSDVIRKTLTSIRRETSRQIRETALEVGQGIKTIEVFHVRRNCVCLVSPNGGSLEMRPLEAYEVIETMINHIPDETNHVSPKEWTSIRDNLCSVDFISTALIGIRQETVQQIREP